jgi:hypothetical protein
MYTQIITPTEESIVLEVPEELRGHTITVTMDEVVENGKKQFSSVDEFLSHFQAVRIDTKGWKFNRDEANERWNERSSTLM